MVTRAEQPFLDTLKEADFDYDCNIIGIDWKKDEYYIYSYIDIDSEILIDVELSINGKRYEGSAGLINKIVSELIKFKNNLKHE